MFKTIANKSNKSHTLCICCLWFYRGQHLTDHVRVPINGFDLTMLMLTKIYLDHSRANRLTDTAYIHTDSWPCSRYLSGRLGIKDRCELAIFSDSLTVLMKSTGLLRVLWPLTIPFDKWLVTLVELQIPTGLRQCGMWSLRGAGNAYANNNWWLEMPRHGQHYEQ